MGVLLISKTPQGVTVETHYRVKGEQRRPVWRDVLIGLVIGLALVAAAAVGAGIAMWRGM
jgi:uncharacterized protein (DUF2062 family)